MSFDFERENEGNEISSEFGVMSSEFKNRHGFESLGRGNPQLNKQASDKFRSVRFIRRKNPWHIPQRLQHGRQQVKRDRYKLMTFWK
jgi:hypothetical protein